MRTQIILSVLLAVIGIMLMMTTPDAYASWACTSVDEGPEACDWVVPNNPPIIDMPGSPNQPQLPSGPGGGGGVGGTPIIPSDPLSAELECVISKYSPVQPTSPIERRDVYAFEGDDFYHLYNNIPNSVPPSWSPLFGTTSVISGESYIYNRPPQFEEWPYNWYWLSPAGNSGSIAPPFTKFETTLLIAVHEIAHQHGFADQLPANWPAKVALENYRNAQTSTDGSSCR